MGLGTMYTSPEDHREKGTYIAVTYSPGHKSRAMSNRIQIGSTVSARVGPYEPSQSTTGRPLKARVNGKVLSSVGLGEWVVEWFDGLISRQAGKSMRIESQPNSAGNSVIPNSNSAGSTEVVDNAEGHVNPNTAGAGPSVPRGSPPTAPPPSDGTSVLPSVGSAASGSTTPGSSGNSTAPPTILSAAPSSLTTLGSVFESDATDDPPDLAYDSEDDDTGPDVEPDVHEEKIRADRAALLRLVGHITQVKTGANWMVNWTVIPATAEFSTVLERADEFQV